MRSPRILMISTHGYVAAQPELGRPDTGGQVVYVREMSKALAHCGFEVDILTRRFEGQPASEQVAKGVRILRCAYGGNDFLPKEVLAQYVPQLLDAYFQDPHFQDKCYQLISSHYWDAGVAGVKLAKRLGVPHVHTPHSMGLLKRQNRAWGDAGESTADHLTERIQQERVIYHRADLVLSTAAEQTRCLSECDEYNVPSQKVEQIPPGLDDHVFYQLKDSRRMAIKRDLGWDSPTVFSAGRLATSKGYDLLIQSFPAVVKRIPDATLVLAIGGVTRSREENELLVSLKNLAREVGVREHVRFTVCVDQQRLADYYRAADVFVLGSRNEPFGMTAVEAMACGTPTIVSTRGGLWEELTWGHDCIYCDPQDTEALSQAICSPLLHPRIRQQLSFNGSITARSRYTWKKVAHRFLTKCVNRGWIASTTGVELTR
ncbi:glycosyltransferase [Schlesneria sp.]|uniref:glycosyltransferase n=1 Tax=Schlesneria sp. TaxID=2762018 RepID=UPI002EED3F78